MLVTSVSASLRPPLPSAMRSAAQIPTGAHSSAAPTQEGDLREEIRERIEQDPDYQILKRTLARRGEGGQTGSEGPPAEAPVLPAESTDPFTLPQAPAGIEVQGFRVESTGQSFELQIRVEETAGVQRLTLDIVSAEAVQRGDPLVLDLGGGGFRTTGIEGGVEFDLDGDGRLERMSTVYGETWFLALDRNDNGRIDDGRELFGDQNGSPHGFAELARYDENADGRIDAQDPVFSRLRLLQLGAQGKQSLQSLSQARVAAIELNYQHVRKALSAYDQIAQVGRFIRSDGTTGEAADLLLGYRTRA